MNAQAKIFFAQAKARQWISDNFPIPSDFYFLEWYEMLPENWQHLDGEEIEILFNKLKTIKK